MSDVKLASPCRFRRLGGLATLRQLFVQAFFSRASVPADELDDWLKRDTGVAGALPRDRRAAFYRKMLERGQPLL